MVIGTETGYFFFEPILQVSDMDLRSRMVYLTTGELYLRLQERISRDRILPRTSIVGKVIAPVVDSRATDLVEAADAMSR